MPGITAEVSTLDIGVLATVAVAPPYFMALQAWPQLHGDGLAPLPA